MPAPPVIPLLRRLLTALLLVPALAAAGDHGRCDEPVIMLVYGEIYDRAAFERYADALAGSGLYDKYGGYYLAISPILAVFEGDPPPGRGMVAARFPCAERARAFWHDPVYEEIKRLRAGAADFEVTLLRALPVPADGGAGEGT